MSFRFLSAFLGAAALLVGFSAQATTVLRVCADPNNLPFSNDAGQGFENKLAELVAAKLGSPLAYTWWSERKSFVKNSLQAGKCDVLLGIPSTLDSVEVTRPYYRSSYVFVTRRDSNLDIKSLSDFRLAKLRIGIQVVGEDFAPPAFALARRGITRNVTGFRLFGNFGEANPPRKIIDAVENRQIDVAIVWGPFAGYFAQSVESPLLIEPVSPSVYLGVPFTYSISMGVRKGDDALKEKLNAVLQSDSAAVERILSQFGVPEVRE